MMASIPLTFYVNGKRIEERDVDPETTLLLYLRDKLRLTGCKLGCGDGGCGACTVMVSRVDRYPKNIRFIRNEAINACLVPVCSLHGQAVTTVEGIGSVETRLHPVQERLALAHGTQCGFCSPGFVMSMYTLLRNNPTPSMAQITDALKGNLCRCTGYTPILEGYRTFSKEYQTECIMGDECCKKKPKKEVARECTNLFSAAEFAPYDPSQEPIFPSELQLNDTYDSQSLCYPGDRVTYYRPVSLQELLTLKADNPDARLLVGGTEARWEINVSDVRKKFTWIDIRNLPELRENSVTNEGVTLGASASLSSVESVLKNIIKPENEMRTLYGLLEVLSWYGATQTKNVVGIGSSILTRRATSDILTVLAVSECTLHLQDKDGARTLKLDMEYLQNGGKSLLKPGEVLISITIPYSKQCEHILFHKQSMRGESDFPILSAAIKVEVENDTVRNVALCYSGAAASTKPALHAMEALKNRELDDSVIADACSALRKDYPIPAGTPGGRERYRSVLVTSIFFKFYLKLLQIIRKNVPLLAMVTPRRSRMTLYEEVPPGQSADDAVGRPMLHHSALQLVTGEAVFLDDMPVYCNELHLVMVRSNKAHARLLTVDTSEAVEAPGVHGFISAKDVDTSLTDLFADGTVTREGHGIVGIVAETREQAVKAAKLVKVEYEPLKSIITIQEAIENKSFYCKPKVYHVGDPDSAIENAAHVIEGEVYMGTQEHFYLEPHCSLADYKPEDQELHLYCATQAPMKNQTFVSSILGIPNNKVIVKVKRIGGGFGGKNHAARTTSIPASVASKKFKRPVRMVLDRYEDMRTTGQRHSVYTKYKIGVTDSGEFCGIDLCVYLNCGYADDKPALSTSFTLKLHSHIDSCYRMPNLRVTTHWCKTNVPLATTMRAFGIPQALFIAETLVQEIGVKLGMSAEQVREVNMYRDNDVTPYGHVIQDATVQRCWKDVLATSQFESRKAAVDKFNRENRWKKRGISATPGRQGVISSQGAALVHIYTDGSVLVTHGGVEMGQGLHTKLIQIASRALEVPVTRIHLGDTDTSKVPNGVITAASHSTDLYGMAVLNACKTLRERLEPYITKNPEGSWEEWVTAAYNGLVSLSATGFYQTPGFNYDPVNFKSNPHLYQAFGAAVSEVEIDCLTGDHTVLRTDIVMDVGTSLNPAIDIGQITGAFLQGYAFHTFEECTRSSDGLLRAVGTEGYKIPTLGNVPKEFNVQLLKGASNPKAVYSSKAVGEPPLLLSASVFFALKEAILAARAEAGIVGNFRLDSPATCDKIRLACQDQFTDQVKVEEDGSHKPWAAHNV